MSVMHFVFQVVLIVLFQLPDLGDQSQVIQFLWIANVERWWEVDIGTGNWRFCHALPGWIPWALMIKQSHASIKIDAKNTKWKAITIMISVKSSCFNFLPRVLARSAAICDSTTKTIHAHWKCANIHLRSVGSLGSFFLGDFTVRFILYHLWAELLLSNPCKEL